MTRGKRTKLNNKILYQQPQFMDLQERAIANVPNTWLTEQDKHKHACNNKGTITVIMATVVSYHIMCMKIFAATFFIIHILVYVIFIACLSISDCTSKASVTNWIGSWTSVERTPMFGSGQQWCQLSDLVAIFSEYSNLSSHSFSKKRLLTNLAIFSGVIGDFWRLWHHCIWLRQSQSLTHLIHCVCASLWRRLNT